MSRHRRLVGLLGVGVAVACCGVGVAWAAVTPPAGTPDLALMVLQPADLAPGAVSGAQGYVAPPKGLTAQYAADFTTASSPDGVNYSLLVDDVAVGPTASASSAYFVAQRKSIASTKGRRGIVRSILHSAAKADHLKAKDVKFSAAGSAGVGTSSYIETLTISTKHRKLREILLVFDDGTAEADLVLAGEVNERIPRSDATGLATTLNMHIESVLATGATGPSGASGASGLSGASGVSGTSGASGSS
jgi:hypothetical protein